MYAVIKTGGKQYKVAVGEKIKVEQIAADAGQEVVFDEILAVGKDGQIEVGTPLVAGATVKATVLEQGKHDKVRIFKMRRRKHYQKRQGHRQRFTALFIAEIASSLGSASQAYVPSEPYVADAASAAKPAKAEKADKVGSKAEKAAKPAKAEKAEKAAKPAKAAKADAADKPAKAEKPAKASKAKATGDEASAE